MNVTITSLTLQMFQTGNLLSSSIFSGKTKLELSRSTFRKGFIKGILQNFDNFKIINTQLIRISQEDSSDNSVIKRQRVIYVDSDPIPSLFEGCYIHFKGISFTSQDAIAFKQCYIRIENQAVLLYQSCSFDQCVIYDPIILMYTHCSITNCKTDLLNIDTMTTLTNTNSTSTSEETVLNSEEKMSISYCALSSVKIQIDNAIIVNTAIQDLQKHSRLMKCGIDQLLFLNIKQDITVSLYNYLYIQNLYVDEHSLNLTFQASITPTIIKEIPNGIPTVTPKKAITNVVYKVQRKKMIEFPKSV